jgi:hypothetical protein
LTGGHLLCDTALVKAYCVSYGPGVAVVIDARADTLIRSIPLGRYPEDLCWNRTCSRVYITDQMDNVVYVIKDSAAGLQELGADRAALIPAYAVPTPFADQTTIEWSPSAHRIGLVRIYSHAGMLVRTLDPLVSSSGVVTATWDGATERGTQAPPGVYVARPDSPEAARVKMLRSR